MMFIAPPVPFLTIFVTAVVMTTNYRYSSLLNTWDITANKLSGPYVNPCYHNGLAMAMIKFMEKSVGKLTFNLLLHSWPYGTPE